jgi:hypothetical protein
LKLEGRKTPFRHLADPHQVAVIAPALLAVCSRLATSFPVSAQATVATFVVVAVVVAEFARPLFMIWYYIRVLRKQNTRAFSEQKPRKHELETSGVTPKLTK